jgi:3-oxoacyl-[acyl-carrier protein] reductase
VAATVQAFDWLDILVNNAGIAIVKPFDDVTLDDFDRIVAVNVKGLFRGHRKRPAGSAKAIA